MVQTLKYVIGKDYRPLTVLEAKGGNTFTPDYNKGNWVQARQYEDNLRQVFVEITNEDGSAYDLTGANVLFEGILPDNEHKILDNSHVVFYEDPTTGKFRFDMPAQAFSVAGQYKQAFFRVMKDYRNIATLEFKFEVLADMVVTGLVPRDYISPLDDLFNTIKETETKNVAELKKIVDDKINEITDLMTTLNQTNTSTLAELGAAKQSLLSLEQKIRENGLFTQYEADQYKQSLDDRLNNLSKEMNHDLANTDAKIQQTDRANINLEKKVNDLIQKTNSNLADMDAKIQQSNRDNASLVEDRLAQIDNEIHAYPNADAIKQAYPSGKGGIFIAIDTGHQWYYVNGSWKDGGVYQSTGVDFQKAPSNKLGGYVVPLSTRSIGISYGSNQTITIYLPDKILYTSISPDGKVSLEGATVTQSTIDFVNGEYLIFDIISKKFKNVTQGGLNSLSEFIVLGYNSYGYFKGPWINCLNSYRNLNYSKNLLIFPSNDLKISFDVSSNAVVEFDSKNLYYQKLDSNELGTYTIAEDKIVVPDVQYLIFDLSQKKLRVLNEKQFIAEQNDCILCFYNYHGQIFGQWSTYFKENGDGLPGYYHTDNYIENKIDKINENSSIASGVNFAYITDTHYGDNAGQSGKLLKYIKQNTAISSVVFGGDIVRSYGTKDIAVKDVKKYTKLVDDMGVVYGTKGNHDITIRTSAGETTGWTAPQSTIYNILNRKNERLIDNGINNKSYYYFDNKIQKVRFIVLDQYEDVQSGETTYWGTKSKFSQEQLDWLINKALNIDGYTLVVFTHSPSDSAMQYYSPYLDVVQKLLVAVNNKQHFTYNQNELTADVDFSKTTNTIACHLSGHAHIDETHVDNGVLSIGVLCDAAYNDDPQYKDKPRTKGTINEQAFDVVSLDTTSRTIKLVRIGQGNDREFSY